MHRLITNSEKNMDLDADPPRIEAQQNKNDTSNLKKTFFYLQALGLRPARTYDCIKLELLGTGQPKDNSYFT